MIGMLLQQFEQYGASLVRRAFQRIDTTEIQVRLVETRRNANAFFKGRYRLIAPLSSQIENSKIVQSLGIHGPGSQRALQIFVGARSVAGLRKDHSQAVVGFGIAGADRNGVLQNFAGLLPLSLLTISVA